MKKFVLLTIGFENPTLEVMNNWMKWFNSIKDNIIEQVGLGDGMEVSKKHVKAIPMDKYVITGYLVINAKDKDEAISIAKKCPMITSTHVYEVREH